MTESPDEMVMPQLASHHQRSLPVDVSGVGVLQSTLTAVEDNPVKSIPAEVILPPVILFQIVSVDSLLPSRHSPRKPTGKAPSSSSHTSQIHSHRTRNHHLYIDNDHVGYSQAWLGRTLLILLSALELMWTGVVNGELYKWLKLKHVILST